IQKGCPYAPDAAWADQNYTTARGGRVLYKGAGGTRDWSLTGRITEMLTTERRGQYAAFAALSLWAVGLTGILARSHAILFQPYFGDADPRLMVLTLIGAGGVSLHQLYARGWFDIFKADGRGAAFSATLAALFAAEAIAA